MVNDKREFYKRLAEDSLKDVKTKRTLKTARTTPKNNDYTTRNGMIKLDVKDNEKKSSSFFTQCIICILIIGIFYYLTNSNNPRVNDFIEKTKNIINSEFNMDKIIYTFKGNNKKDGVSIDDKVLEEMEQEIEDTKK